MRVLLAGDDLLAVDLVGTRLMGFDWKKVKVLRCLVESSSQDVRVRDPAEIEVCSTVEAWKALTRDESAPDLRFTPHPAWVGRIELEQPLPATVGAP